MSIHAEIGITEARHRAGLQNAMGSVGVELKIINKTKESTAGCGVDVAIALFHDRGAGCGFQHGHQCSQSGLRISNGPVGPGAVGWTGAGSERPVLNAQIRWHRSNEMEQRKGEREQQMSHG